MALKSCLFFQALNWNLNPLTVVSWLNIYLQVAYLNNLYEVMLPQYPQQIFVQITEVRLISFKCCFTWKTVFVSGLLNICCLTALGSLCAGYWLLGIYLWNTCSFCFVSLLFVWVDAESFRYSHLKTSILCVDKHCAFIQADKHVSCVAGYEFCEIEDCVKWMVPFAMALREVGSSKLKHFTGIAPEDLHNIQTHINSFDLLVCMCRMKTKTCL